MKILCKVILITQLSIGIVELSNAEQILDDAQLEALVEPLSYSDIKQLVADISIADKASIKTLITSVGLIEFNPENEILLTTAYQRWADIDLDDLVRYTQSDAIQNFSYSRVHNHASIAFSAMTLVAPQRTLELFLSLDPTKHELEWLSFSSFADSIPEIAFASLRKQPESFIIDDAIRSLLYSWAKLDPKAAALAALSWRQDTKMTNDQYGQSQQSAHRAIANILVTWAVSEPDVVFEIARTELSREDQSNFLMQYAASIARINPVDGYRNIELWPDKEVAEGALKSLLSRWGHSDPDGMKRFAGTLDNSAAKHSIKQVQFSEVMTMAQSDPLAALQYSEQLPDEDRPLIRANIVRSWMSREPDAALEWINAAEEKERSYLLGMFGSSLPYRNASGSINADITQRLFKLLPEEYQLRAMPDVLSWLQGTNPDAVEPWINSMLSEVTQMATREMIEIDNILQAALTDPIDALNRASLLSEENRMRILRSCFHSAVEKYPESARQWLESADILQDEKVGLGYMLK